MVKRILRAYKEDARDWERINDWIDRVGWPRFFELTELPFTKFHIDNWRGSRKEPQRLDLHAVLTPVDS